MTDTTIFARLVNGEPAQKGNRGDLGQVGAVIEGVWADWGIPPIGVTDVDAQIIATLQMWFATYLTQTEQDMGLAKGYFPRPPADHFQGALESMEFLDYTLPAVIVTTAQTERSPVKTATAARPAVWQAQWRVVVSSIVRGPDKLTTRQNASNFERTVRRCLLDKVTQMGGTPVSHLDWTGSQVAPVADTTGGGRYLAAGIGQYVATVDEAAQNGFGPSVPDADPYGELPVVSDVPVDIEPIEES